MKNIFGFYTFLVICVACVMGCIFPYPVFATSSILNEQEQKKINDAYEQENVITVPTPKVDVLKLDWFETVNTYFPTFVKTRVIDVQTQKSYYVKRTGGHFHADVEAIDSTNTAIFKSLYGDWSWTRRPVWVEINGTFVAASINGMPHGYSLITNNNENGHTCIHFLNSKTHGTQRVDEAHQNAIETAYNRQEELNEYLLSLREI